MPCSLEKYCDLNDGQRMIDWHSHESLKNWTYEMDMNCSESWEIGLFGSLYFLGVAVSTLLMKFGDWLGWRNFMLIGGIF